jgi:mRNA turnover protein 4
MPRSKRNKVVALTKTKKQGKSAKEDLKSNVQEAIDTYKNTFVLSFENMRAGPFKDIAHKSRSDSKYFLGKNKVVQVALGRTAEEEYGPNSHQLSKYMKGHVCLCTTNKTLEQLETFIKE